MCAAMCLLAAKNVCVCACVRVCECVCYFHPTCTINLELSVLHSLPLCRNWNTSRNIVVKHCDTIHRCTCFDLVVAGVAFLFEGPTRQTCRGSLQRCWASPVYLLWELRVRCLPIAVRRLDSLCAFVCLCAVSQCVQWYCCYQPRCV